MSTGRVNSATGPESKGKPLPITSPQNRVISALQKQQTFNGKPSPPQALRERERERDG